MQEIQGWDIKEQVHACRSPTSRPWEGQWETFNHSDKSGQWDNWGSLSNNGSVFLDDFENIMKWDDSGALEAYRIANERQEAFFRGLIYPIPLPSPELYIQSIDWENHEYFNPSDYSENWSNYRENNGQRKRDRHSGSGFKYDKRGNKHGGRQGYNESFDSKQMNQLMSNRSNQTQTQCQWDQNRSYNSHISEKRGQDTYYAAINGPSIEKQGRSSSVMSHDTSAPALMQKTAYLRHVDHFHPAEAQMWLPRRDPQSQQNHYRQQQHMPGGSQGCSTSNVSHERSHGFNNHHQYNAKVASSGKEYTNQHGLTDQCTQSARGRRQLHPAPW